MTRACASIMADRVAALDWSRIAAKLDAQGRAVASGVLRRSGAASITTSRILFPRSSAIFAPPRPHQFPASRIAGMRPWASQCAIRTTMRVWETQGPLSMHAARRPSHSPPLDTEPDHSRSARGAGAAAAPTPSRCASRDAVPFDGRSRLPPRRACRGCDRRGPSWLGRYVGRSHDCRTPQTPWAHWTLVQWGAAGVGASVVSMRQVSWTAILRFSEGTK